MLAVWHDDDDDDIYKENYSINIYIYNVVCYIPKEKVLDIGDRAYLDLRIAKKMTLWCLVQSVPRLCDHL